MYKLSKQESTILQYLTNHGTITSMEAIDLFGYTRLSAIIFNLREKKVPITSVFKRVMTRDGSMTSIAVYHLEKDVWEQRQKVMAKRKAKPQAKTKGKKAA